MAPPQTVVAAPILARDLSEANRLLAAVTRLSEHRLPILMVDGGSPGAFVERLTLLPGVTVQPIESPEPGLLAQVKQALAAAHGTGARHVLYTEPDKAWFFERRLSDFLVQREDDSASREPGIRVAARDPASFATFPSFQQLTESQLNHLCEETLRRPGDFTYGPLLLPSELIPHITAIPENIGWGWRIFALAVCHRLGRSIDCWTADLPCPIDQRGENEEKSRLYRMDQLSQNVRGLVLGMRHPLPAS